MRRLCVLLLVAFLFFGTIGAKYALADDKISVDNGTSKAANLSTTNETQNGINGMMEEFIVAQQDIPDPFEPVNRASFTFNDKLYYWVLRPAAKAYGYVIPEAIRKSLDNFMYNSLFPVRFINSILQGNFDKAGYEFVRFLVNVVTGLGGLADSAGECFGMDRNYSNEDFGQTLGYYGIGEVAYLYIPFYGPSTIRDVVGEVVDTFGNPAYYVMSLWTFFGYEAFYRFNKFSLDVDLYDEIKKESFDPYIAVRNYYINYRRELIRR
ncbi:MAG: MlaA family lipoprotein [Thermosulfidibacteraceae bacterium]|jgi:phospholipid-binding lipoprotein MlaA